ncbi:SDR family NAD(P)-dependent oxidoreductase [Thalassospiraceae bacterium LMO-SO8]|nr:SDR family oxidoreductase [Alphaproteobacteria bacterium LMO-S08]WND74591.1 SDR family NAD(P)-dependent oxidoreductase [Thalassospiraceae bacterium LMO-SO8]|tara:strand:- start:70099 stop:70875 length:777 start_codon:yes stop_codon:yes gene_type:complete
MTRFFRDDLLADRVALVTGASSGLGRRFAEVLAAHGAAVACCARRREKLAETVDAITAAGGQALAVEMDVTDRESVADAFETADRALGQVTILINNAGLASTGPAIDLDPATWDQTMATNLTGAWTVAQRAAKDMVAAGRPGTIVNVASVLGLRQAGGVMPYAVSKAGIVQMTKSLALEWARHRIRVNAIAPGYIETDLNREFLESEGGQTLMKRIPQRRFGKPEDLDGALLLLASDASDFMTGEVVAVDGGHLVNTL